MNEELLAASVWLTVRWLVLATVQCSANSAAAGRQVISTTLAASQTL
jgi:hypothetical protein